MNSLKLASRVEYLFTIFNLVWYTVTILGRIHTRIKIHFFFHVPILCRTDRIMALHSFTSYVVAIVYPLLSVFHVTKLFTIFYLLRLLSVCPMSVNFPKPSFLIMRPGNYSCIFLIVSICFVFSLKFPHYSNVLSMAFVGRTMSLQLFSSTFLSIILLHSSSPSFFFCLSSSFFFVHHSLLYRI